MEDGIALDRVEVREGFGGEKENLGRYRSRVREETAGQTRKDKSGELSGYLMAHRGGRGRAGGKHSVEDLGKKSRSSCESRDRKKSLFGEWNGSWPRVGCRMLPQAEKCSASGIVAAVTQMWVPPARRRADGQKGRKRRCRRCKWSAAGESPCFIAFHWPNRYNCAGFIRETRKIIGFVTLPYAPVPVDMKTPNCPAVTLIIVDPRCISSNLQCQPPWSLVSMDRSQYGVEGTVRAHRSSCTPLLTP